MARTQRKKRIAQKKKRKAKRALRHISTSTYSDIKPEELLEILRTSDISDTEEQELRKFVGLEYKLISPSDLFPDPFWLSDIMMGTRLISLQPRERGLCAGAQRWHNGKPLGYEKYQGTEDAYGYIKVKNVLNQEYNLTELGTSFKLGSLPSILAHQSDCTLCSLVVRALRTSATQMEIDQIAKGSKPVEFSFEDPVRRDNTLDRFILHVNIGYAAETKKADLIHPMPVNTQGALELAYIQLNQEHLPQTIKDAMFVVNLLGEKYLWVDALCIIQDDPVEKANTISNMHSIYQSAVLTIVAASGKDADSGLIGLRPSSRNVESVTGSVDGIGLLKIENEIELSSTPWEHRAWTYQEGQFSRRLLLFANNRVYYQCKKGSFGEARPQQPLHKKILDQHFGTGIANLSMMHLDHLQPFEEYTKHVMHYTPRMLRYKGDILNAFAGITGNFQRKHGFTFLWGLPIQHFDGALTWEPSRPLHRRNARDIPSAGQETEFPSWSWTGWVGGVNYSLFVYPRLEDPQLFSSIVWPWQNKDKVNAKEAFSLFKSGNGKR
ncbi:hypothetical protein H2199_009150 [Coniosporium tulheliwenetii]|uniref:Uncharacterized protein n=1 Tax=Coniosporium tulheliwenetii TaxID=3383036 RepID=A0ACC2YF56_9PEZI|nr:hypothetical protein H2199_009150 [Cladosporium sp. JES 115]